MEEGVRHADPEAPVPGGVPPTDWSNWSKPAAHPRSLRVSSACSAQSISTWVAQAAADNGKPVRGKDVLSSAEREELVRLRRQLRQVRQERDILAKATAWFAVKGDKTSTGSTNS